MGPGGNGNGLRPRGRGLRHQELGAEPAADRHARLLRHDGDRDRPRPGAHHRGSARRAEGDGGERGARAGRCSRAPIRSAGASPAASRDPTARARTTRRWSASPPTRAGAARPSRRRRSSTCRPRRFPADAWEWIQRTLYVDGAHQRRAGHGHQPVARGDRADRARRAAVRRAHHGAADRRVAADRTLQHAAADDPRRPRRRARGGRHLRGHRLLRDPPDPGARRPDGARRVPRRRHRTGRPPGASGRSDWASRWVWPRRWRRPGC